MSFIKTPNILLPVSSIDKNKWAVIACDQFTSEPEYWDQLKALVDNAPSTFHMILPEAYLHDEPLHRINKINDNMNLYLRSHIFEEHHGFILVERQTPYVKRRLGLVISVDLDTYEYEEGKKGRIRSTEKTVAERIPPRVKIRENTPVELPHVLVLMDDRNEKIIHNLYKSKRKLKKVYDFELNMDGGHLKGYLVSDTEPIIHQIENLPGDINVIVGDGNHSLASAKVCWENIKKDLPENELENHPARFALVELISLYDEGLTFEPIHRVLYNADFNVVKTLENQLSGDGELDVYFKNEVHHLKVPNNPFTAIKQIQEILDEYISRNQYIEIDFVHGIDSLKKIVKQNEDSVGISMPALKRDMLFPYIAEYGVLPRKSFSLGEAVEKRYYMESKRIQK
jgi:uncharacterized protein (DUF1015 family)